MKHILTLTLIIYLISCSKEQTEQNNYLPKGVDTLPSFVVKVPVKIFINDDVPSYWVSAVKGAVDEWNSLKVTPFEIVGNKSESTTIVYMDDFSGADAYASLPGSINSPGQDIILNKKTFLNRSQMLYVIVHELGHTIGFRHIYSTTSVMNRVGARNWEGFYGFDITLINKYY